MKTKKKKASKISGFEYEYIAFMNASRAKHPHASWMFVQLPTEIIIHMNPGFRGGGINRIFVVDEEGNRHEMER